MTHDHLVSNYGLPSEHEMAVFSTMSKKAVSSRMYRNLGDESAVMMIMLAAREFGIPAMQALNGGINIINGKVELSARMIGALIRRGGHEISVKECNETRCVLWGKRKGTANSLQVSYTIQEAQKAGLVKQGGGWTKNPSDMCYARALSRLARQLFPDVIGIGYVHGEISEVQEAEPLDDMLNDPEPLPLEESEESLTNRFVDLFIESDDKIACMTYLKVIIAHFNWTTRQALEKMLTVPEKTIEAYHKWKNKNTPISKDADPIK